MPRKYLSVQSIPTGLPRLRLRSTSPLCPRRAVTSLEPHPPFSPACSAPCHLMEGDLRVPAQCPVAPVLASSLPVIITQAPIPCPLGCRFPLAPGVPFVHVPGTQSRDAHTKNVLGRFLWNKPLSMQSWTQPVSCGREPGTRGSFPRGLYELPKNVPICQRLCFRSHKDQGNRSESSWRGRSRSVSPPGPSCPPSLSASPFRPIMGPVEHGGVLVLPAMWCEELASHAFIAESVSGYSDTDHGGRHAM